MRPADYGADWREGAMRIVAMQAWLVGTGVM